VILIPNLPWAEQDSRDAFKISPFHTIWWMHAQELFNFSINLWDCWLQIGRIGLPGPFLPNASLRDFPGGKGTFDGMVWQNTCRLFIACN
jgi:hypothetical protein